MKPIIKIYVVILVTLLNACSKDIHNSTDNAPSLTPDKADANAGNWKPILLVDAEEFPVPAPDSVNKPDYIAQLSEIKSWQAAITEDEKATVKYWSAGAVLRWNELLRELVAKHNIPPYQNA